MLKRVCCLVVLSLCAGCVTMPAAERWSFEKAGVSEADAKRDRSQCFATAVDGDARLNSSPTKIDRAIYRACMEKRGYTLRVEK